jgi:hypothetical protein
VSCPHVAAAAVFKDKVELPASLNRLLAWLPFTECASTSQECTLKEKLAEGRLPAFMLVNGLQLLAAIFPLLPGDINSQAVWFQCICSIAEYSKTADMPACEAVRIASNNFAAVRSLNISFLDDPIPAGMRFAIALSKGAFCETPPVNQNLATS